MAKRQKPGLSAVEWAALRRVEQLPADHTPGGVRVDVLRKGEKEFGDILTQAQVRERKEEWAREDALRAHRRARAQNQEQDQVHER